MACSGMVEKLSCYLDGALTRTEMREVEEHLLGCAACRAELEGLGSLIDEVRSLGELEPPPGLPEAVLQRLRQEPRAITAARGSRWYWWPLGVGLAAALLVGVALRTLGERGELPGGAGPAAFQAASAPAAAERSAAPGTGEDKKARDPQAEAVVPEVTLEAAGAPAAVPEAPAASGAPQVKAAGQDEAAGGAGQGPAPAIRAMNQVPAQPSRGSNGKNGSAQHQDVNVTVVGRAGLVVTIRLVTTREAAQLAGLLEPLAVQMGGQLEPAAPAGALDMLLPARSWEQVRGPLAELGEIAGEQVVDERLADREAELLRQLSAARAELAALEGAGASATEAEAARQQADRLQAELDRLREAQKWALVRVVPVRE